MSDYTQNNNNVITAILEVILKKEHIPERLVCAK